MLSKATSSVVRLPSTRRTGSLGKRQPPAGQSRPGRQSAATPALCASKRKPVKRAPAGSSTATTRHPRPAASSSPDRAPTAPRSTVRSRACRSAGQPAVAPPAIAASPHAALSPGGHSTQSRARMGAAGAVGAGTTAAGMQAPGAAGAATGAGAGLTGAAEGGTCAWRRSDRSDWRHVLYRGLFRRWSGRRRRYRSHWPS